MWGQGEGQGLDKYRKNPIGPTTTDHFSILLKFSYQNSDLLGDLSKYFYKTIEFLGVFRHLCPFPSERGTLYLLI